MVLAPLAIPIQVGADGANPIHTYTVFDITKSVPLNEISNWDPALQWMKTETPIVGNYGGSNNPLDYYGTVESNHLGKNSAGGIKIKNKWAHKIKLDCIILDEYHYGSWRDTAKELYEHEDKREQVLALGDGIESWDENISPLKTNHYLYLSGTPFRAIESGEFIEEQIFNWTYSDEQNAKINWKNKNNPYKSLPRMVMMTYQLPEQITQITSSGEYNEFDLNVFFKAKGELDNSEFIYKIAC